MYRLYAKISKGLDPIANVFKQHITYEGSNLVQEAEEIASNQVQYMHVLHRINLCNKVCLGNGFIKQSLNQLIFQALYEAFVLLCNKTVAGSSSEELLSSFCDIILRKGRSDNMSHEAIEETFEKVAFDHLCFLHRFCISIVLPKLYNFYR
jgi:cullin 1